MSEEQVAEATQEPAVDEQKPEFTAEEIAKYKELRAEAAQRRKENAALAKELAELKAAQEEANNAKLAEQGEYKAIAEKANERVKELQAVAEENEKLTGVVAQLLETQRAGLPESIITLLDKLPAVEQLEWLATNKDTLTAKPEPEPEPTQQATQPGLSPFDPNSGQVKENTAQRLARLYNQTSGNTPFG